MKANLGRVLVPLALAAAGMVLRADSTAVHAEEEIERGRMLIRDLQEEQALGVLAPYLEDASLPKPLRARALIYTGIADFDLGDEPSARKAFDAALSADSGAVLPEWVSRKVRSAFEEVLQARADAQRRLEDSLRKKAEAPKALAKDAPLPAPAIRLFVGAGVVAIVSLASFAEWATLHARSEDEKVALDAKNLDDSAVPWFYIGEGAAAAAAGLAVAGGIVWTVAPTPQGAVVGVTGRF
jgi:hypothetical protein